MFLTLTMTSPSCPPQSFPEPLCFNPESGEFEVVTTSLTITSPSCSPQSFPEPLCFNPESGGFSGDRRG